MESVDFVPSSSPRLRHCSLYSPLDVHRQRLKPSTARTTASSIVVSAPGNTSPGSTSRTSSLTTTLRGLVIAKPSSVSSTASSALRERGPWASLNANRISRPESSPQRDASGYFSYPPSIVLELHASDIRGIKSGGTTSRTSPWQRICTAMSARARGVCNWLIG